jgi:uncharacterized small protein (DUF1192 family)
MIGVPRELAAMDSEDTTPRTADPLALVVRQDLDPLSVADCAARIETLEAEIVRTRNRMARAVDHHASAAAMFKR